MMEQTRRDGKWTNRVANKLVEQTHPYANPFEGRDLCPSLLRALLAGKRTYYLEYRLNIERHKRQRIGNCGSIIPVHARGQVKPSAAEAVRGAALTPAQETLYSNLGKKITI